MISRGQRNKGRTVRWLAAIAATMSGLPAAAQEITGQIDLGFRYYLEDGRFDGQSQAGAHPFLGFELNATAPAGPGELVLQFYGLSDEENGRSSLFVQKAYYYLDRGGWDAVVGFNVENWSVSSGRSLVNVLNARDRTNQVGGSELIGTPMLNANVYTGAGTFSAYALFGNVRDNYGDERSRHRGPLATDTAFTVYEDGDSIDLALRYSNNFTLGAGSLDIGAYAYSGTAREAVGLPGCIGTFGAVTPAVCGQINAAAVAAYQAGAPPPASQADIADFLLTNFGVAVALAAANGDIVGFTPYYQEIRQYGLTAVYANGDTQLRFEGFLRETALEDFTAGIVGAERSFYDFAGGAGTLTLALEYHFDDRSARQPTTVFDDDLFFGASFSANDTRDSRAQFGLFYDLETEAQLYSLSLSRRIGDRVRLEISANHIETDGGADPLSYVDGDTFIGFTLTTFF